RDADGDMNDPFRGHFGEEVEVACHQGVLGDHAHRLPRLGRHLQNAARQAVAAFTGLVAIGDAGQGDPFGHPARAVEEVAEERGGVLLDDDFRLEVQARVVAEVLVCGAGVAVAATVLTMTHPWSSGWPGGRGKSSGAWKLRPAEFPQAPLHLNTLIGILYSVGGLSRR